MILENKLRMEQLTYEMLQQTKDTLNEIEDNCQFLMVM